MLRETSESAAVILEKVTHNQLAVERDRDVTDHSNFN
jgi:hypothetical protein